MNSPCGFPTQPKPPRRINPSSPLGTQYSTFAHQMLYRKFVLFKSAIVSYWPPPNDSTSSATAISANIRSKISDAFRDTSSGQLAKRACLCVGQEHILFIFCILFTCAKGTCWHYSPNGLEGPAWMHLTPESLLIVSLPIYRGANCFARAASGDDLYPGGRL